MVVETSMLAGRSSSSRLHEFPASAPSARKGPLLKTSPGPPKRIPFPFRSQLTLLRGKGSNGQSVASKIAITAIPQRIARSLFSRTAIDLSFTDKVLRTTSDASLQELHRTLQPLLHCAKRPSSA